MRITQISVLLEADYENYSNSVPLEKGYDIQKMHFGAYIAYRIFSTPVLERKTHS